MSHPVLQRLFLLLLLGATQAPALAAEILFNGRVALDQLPADFQVQVPAAGQIRLQVAESEGEGRVLLALASDRAHAVPVGGLLDVPAGPVDLVLTAQGEMPPGPLFFRLLHRPAEEADEPDNGEFGNAREVEVERHFALDLHPGGDVDWLVFEASHHGYVWLETEGGTSADGTVSARFHVPGREPAEGSLRVEPGMKVGVELSVADGREAGPLVGRIAFAPELDVSEDNGTAERAAEVTAGPWYLAQIAPAGDRDFLRVEMPFDGYLIPEVRDARVFLRWDLHREDGEVVTAPVFRLAAGRYLLSFRARYDREWNPQPFDFRLRPVAELDPAETAAGGVQTLALGEAGRFILGTPGDGDSFRIQVPKAGLLVPVVADYDRPLQLDWVFTVDGRESRGPALLLTRAGEVRVRAHARYGDAHSLRPVTVRFELREIAGAPEPNDRPDQAIPLRLGETVQVQVFPPDDRDYYSIQVPSAGDLYGLAAGLRRWAERGLAPEIELLDANGRVLGSFGQRFLDPRRVVHVPAAGTYYLRHRSGGYEGLPITYDFVMDFVPEGQAPPSGSGFGGLYIVGIDPADRADVFLRAMANRGEGGYVRAGAAVGLDEAVRSVAGRLTAGSELARAESTLLEDVAGGPVEVEREPGSLKVKVPVRIPEQVTEQVEKIGKQVQEIGAQMKRLGEQVGVPVPEGGGHAWIGWLLAGVVAAVLIAWLVLRARTPEPKPWERRRPPRMGDEERPSE
jgi:hypothetical protein